MNAVNSKDKLGIVVLVVVLLGGAWLMVAPFLVGYQSRGGHWTDGTTNEFFLGLALVVLAVSTAAVFTANALHEMVAASRRAAAEAAASVEPTVDPR